MDRKEFLRGCATGLCACAAACVPALAASAAEPAKEDWRIGFVRRRHAKLLTSLGQHMDQASLTASMREMGEYCSSEQDETTRKFAGNVDGFAKKIAQNGSTIERQDDKTLILTYDPKGDCFCPMASTTVKTPAVMCECSAGWARHTWSIILQKDVKVAVKDSVLRGGKVCRFEITEA